MGKDQPKNLLLIILGLFLIANLVFLDVIFITNKKEVTLNKTENIEEFIRPETPNVSKVSELSKADDIDKTYIQSVCQEEIGKTIATLSSQAFQTKEAVRTAYQAPSIPSHPSVVYFPLGGGSSTVTRDWGEFSSAEAYFDKADYPGAKKISFEIFLKIKHRAGEANVRLYDATHGVVISGSELLGGGEQFEKKSSGALGLLTGNNLYKVELRSTTGYEAYMESPRLKIEY